ncbi:hypothetical protein [Nocardia paucivorans]|uniref:hypothetical protein n=1 Tax=Nocardia paucivorans TaxID=114259 RepID=UPI0002EFBC74|nr:hypothetical protein [Nocardia paucivorans]
MSIRFGPTAGVDHRGTARARGTAAGLVSGTISLAAHGWVSAGAAPTGTSIMLLAATSAALGALVAGVGPLRTGSAGLVAALWGGQLLGHLAMSRDSGHLHHGDLQLTPTMIAAHALAALIAAIVIRGAEFAYRIGSAALSRILPIRCPTPVIPGPPSLHIAHRDRVVLWIFAADTGRTRAPPHLVPN